MAEAVTKGLPILIDLVYEEHMNAKERTSLAVQIELIYKSMRKLDNPCSLHLCSLGNTIEEQLIGMRYHFWPMTSHKESVAEVAKKLGKEPIYLSPDGREELKEVNTGNESNLA
jgi:Trm5-related predicted tRNA methylase